MSGVILTPTTGYPANRFRWTLDLWQVLIRLLLYDRLDSDRDGPFRQGAPPALPPGRPVRIRRAVRSLCRRPPLFCSFPGGGRGARRRPAPGLLPTDPRPRSGPAPARLDAE